MTLIGYTRYIFSYHMELDERENKETIVESFIFSSSYFLKQEDKEKKKDDKDDKAKNFIMIA